MIALMVNALAKIKRALIKQHYVEFSMVPTLKKKLYCVGQKVCASFL